MMNDRYLFRGKRVDNGEWVQGFFINDSLKGGFNFLITTGGNHIGGLYNGHRIDPATLGQCTGLKDKCGKLIFEGDILRIDDKYSIDGKTPNLVVRYSEKDAGFYAYNEHGSPRSICYSDCYAEIVGNIYDNLKL